jgi:hypothetical protein
MYKRWPSLDDVMGQITRELIMSIEQARRVARVVCIVYLPQDDDSTWYNISTKQNDSQECGNQKHFPTATTSITETFSRSSKFLSWDTWGYTRTIVVILKHTRIC